MNTRSSIAIDASALDALLGELEGTRPSELRARLSQAGAALAISPELLGELCDGFGASAVTRRSQHAKLLLGLPLIALRYYGKVLKEELLGRPVDLAGARELEFAQMILRQCASALWTEQVARLGLETAVDKALARQQSVTRRDNLRGPIPREHHGTLAKFEYEEMEALAWSRNNEKFVSALCAQLELQDSNAVLSRFKMGLFQYPYLRGMFRLLGVDQKQYIAEGRAVRLGDFYDARIAFYSHGVAGVVSEDSGLRDRIMLAFPGARVWSAAEFVRQFPEA